MLSERSILETGYSGLVEIIRRQERLIQDLEEKIEKLTEN
jgi:hypothetical protein